MRSRNLLLLLLILFITKVSKGANYFVNDASLTGDIYCSVAGNNANSGTSAASPKATLTAIWNTYGPAGSNILSTNDTVFVDAGLYFQTDRNLLISVGIVIKGAGIDKTIFDNADGGTTGYFFMRLTSNVVIESFKVYRYGIENTYAQAIQVEPSSTGVKILNIQIDDCGRTTGLYPLEILSGSEVLIQGGGLTCNNGWFLAGGIHIATGTNVIIRNYLFYKNERVENGSALKMDGGDCKLYNCRFQLNRVTGGPRGILYQSGGFLKIYDSEFDQNEYEYTSSAQYGGCILVVGGDLKMTRSKVTNTMKLSSSDAYGSGVCINGGTATARLDSCYFANNSGGRGNDIHVRGSSSSLFAYNCYLGSLSQQVGTSSSGSLTLELSGSPGIYTNTGTTTNLNSSSPTYSANPSVPQFTGVCGTIAILPVELTSFYGECTEGLSALKWVTATEHNNAYFTIEKSIDGSTFQVIAIVNGMLNKTTESIYSFLDMESRPGINYYRLSQTDTDGTKQQLKTISVSNDCRGNGLNEMGLIVNNETSELVLMFNMERPTQIHLSVLNSLGQKIFFETRHVEKQEIINLQLTSSLATGVYHLVVFDGEFQVNRKFLINK